MYGGGVGVDLLAPPPGGGVARPSIERRAAVSLGERSESLDWSLSLGTEERSQPLKLSELLDPRLHEDSIDVLLKRPDVAVQAAAPNSFNAKRPELQAAELRRPPPEALARRCFMRARATAAAWTVKMNPLIRSFSLCSSCCRRRPVFSLREGKEVWATRAAIKHPARSTIHEKSNAPPPEEDAADHAHDRRADGGGDGGGDALLLRAVIGPQEEQDPARGEQHVPAIRGRCSLWEGVLGFGRCSGSV